MKRKVVIFGVGLIGGSFALALKQAGATTVVPETLEASLQLSASVLETLGLDEENIDRIVDEERDLFSATLARTAQLGEAQRQL